jgi:hypothetical protein
MLRNGKIVCDACNLLIDTRYHKHVRIQRPETSGDNPDDFAHYHNRTGHQNDRWHRTVKKETVLASSKKPTQADLTAFEKWQTTRDAKRAVAQKAG